MYPRKLIRDVLKIPKSSVTIQPDDPLRKEFIKFINTLGCPICGAGLDGSIDSSEADLYCRNNPDEYHANYLQGWFVPMRDCIRVHYGSMIYQIKHQHLGYNIFKTDIFKMPENWRETLTKSVDKVMEHEGEILFGATDFNLNLFIEKIEMYDVFA